MSKWTLNTIIELSGTERASNCDRGGLLDTLAAINAVARELQEQRASEREQHIREQTAISDECPF